MPELKDTQHERFAQAIARDFDLADAYTFAGYCWSPSIKIEAAQLLENADIVARIAALRETVPLVITTLEWATADALREDETITDVPTAITACRELEQARKLALTKGRPAAAVAATIAKAKIAGLLADKPEDTPPRPVTFDGNYHEAARRISFLLRLSEKKQTEGGDR